MLRKPLIIKLTIKFKIMDFGRKEANFLNFKDDIYHLAPIPVVYKKLVDVDTLNQQLIAIAKFFFNENILDVPDERQIKKLGNPITFSDEVWKENQIPAIGVWHRVATNNFLKIDEEPVKKLKKIIENEYSNVLQLTTNLSVITPDISESWIQFYKNGDLKVLHNHERYGPPYPAERWSGAYYLDDGEPDVHMPYSGVFSFRVRNSNYYIKPHAGLLLMFPADILHEVHPFYGKTNRIVINFNINNEEIKWNM